ncbi:SDR family NAD(P)-dependent oxidoreductase [Vreelandella titanicae]|uniref:SDR family NAD(P)-dependent oxidoreductase n=1 Tax=Vreelandella titanicae TaxID=664683 RepID=UPI0016809EE2|nr:SDR family NAD(P)-dependent oxidoreductase [Halomonas titanicae]QNU60852.1 SDR family oxidoreductase [Halomonas titanicae]
MMLADKVAIVTGASRGIGRSIANTLAENGASLTIVGTNLKLLNEVYSDVEKMGRECLVFAGDVTNPETAEEVSKKTIGLFGKIDILVNNAGINMRSATLDVELDDWHHVVDVNLNGNFYFSKAVLSHMVERGCGKIVNVSSSTAKSGHKNAAPSYGASKAGVDYLTRHLALEMARYNINVNGVSPGPVETDMIKQWSDDYFEKVTSNVPLKRLGTPKNVADVVLFLASSMSDFLTGETINVNGGTYMN